MWSHCKFISTDGTGHDSVNHRFESKLTQFGWETTKKGVCDEALISRDFKLFLEVDLSRVLSLFQTHPQSTLKPQPSRSVLSWKIGEASRLYASDVTWYHNGREILGERAKGEVTRSALAAPALCSLSFSPSSLTCQCSPSSKACLEHIEVQAWSSPFQWCSIRFWDKFSCGEYYKSKHLGKQSWNEQILSTFLVTFCMLRSERNSSSFFWFTPDHSSVRIDDNSSQIQPEKCRGQQCCIAL